MAKHTNHLIHETSPYLLQHAHNPVLWYAWGNEALTKAKEENKPILVSIGYAACHWCHVMERESFEDETTARIMNDHFINIKIDREERPDLDHIYMDAVQAMTGSGGWPLNVFLTPDTKPFYGGTYFPPRRAFNRASWTETLEGVIAAFRDRRHEIDAQAENLTRHLLEANSFGIKETGDELPDPAMIGDAFTNILKVADKEWGGFGKAPKFPQSFSIQFLLRYHHITKNKEALEQALLSLDKMIEGGIYDQLGGGFARYSTDTEWLAPHFEKMLYDNALLISVLSEAYQLTARHRYKEVIGETMDFIQREFLHPSKGFYAALDADSEGVEGKFYVWSLEEIESLLGNDATVFAAWYDVTKQGNWSTGVGDEHTNILRVKKPEETVAAENGITTDELRKIIGKGREILFNERSKRIGPLLDDKIILGWNALMNTACSKAFGATGKEEYRQLAIDNMQFLLSAFAEKKEHEFYHTWKNDTAKYPAFLDDYAFLIQALLHLQEITAGTKWLEKAESITAFVLENFKETGDPSTVNGSSFFYYTSSKQTDVIVRKKEMYDGAVPSGNSVMAYNLWHLSILFDRNEWKQRSLDMVLGLGGAVSRYPSSFGNWACLLQEISAGTNEIALVGSEFSAVQSELLSAYIPHRVFMAAGKEDPVYPLLAGKPAAGRAAIYLCRNYTCQNPVFSAKELMLLINRPQNG
ncbi:MAG TPA: thioredoxin domain-containing protein [Chitinophagaceae bacterium]|jgi:uncharacterized protein YyaL (SSP411 family)|nr:thioredoxin domain-containing protein [Chitinophagaceae bacterium]